MYYFILVLCVLLSYISQALVSSSYNKYARIANSQKINGATAARNYLDRNGLSDVNVEMTRSGILSDHYNPTNKTIYLSRNVYNSPSIASVAVACHEVGHAIQHKENYRLLVFRNKILPAVQISNRFCWVAILLGLIFGLLNLFYVGVILFAIIVIFQFITLPIELDASNRALAYVKDYVLSEEECGGAKKVLKAAAFTYVASLLSSLVQLFYYVSILGGRRK